MGKRMAVGLLGGHRLPDQTDVSISDTLIRDAIKFLRRKSALDCAEALGLKVTDE